MQMLTNNNGISLAMAVWLAHDDYGTDAVEFPGKAVISATTLLKPIRQLVLEKRVPPSEGQTDVLDLVASSFGRALHDSIESAWSKGYEKAMKRLGLPNGMIKKVKINPEKLEDGDIPVYLEQRFFRELPGTNIVISGKFDQIINGELNDTKTTSVYTYLNRSKSEDYALQGSIYRWINPEKVTSDVMFIQHIFTDWQSFKAKIEPDYPKSRLQEYRVPLLSLEQTEQWIRGRIRQIQANENLPEPEVVRCSDEDLWKSDPVYKYYSNPKTADEGGRSTKNFPNYPAAALYKNQQGKGVVITVPGKVKRCGYCPAFPVCTQKDEYELET